MAEKTSAIQFVRLEDVGRDELLAHMADPRIGKHLPLRDPNWDRAKIDRFVAKKAQHWAKYGLGHWAILIDANYAGWGGFEKTREAWDFALVLRPEYFNCGRQVALKALDWARENTRIEVVTFLLPMSRSLHALQRLKAQPIGYTSLSGITFQKWRLPLRPEQS